MADDMLYCIVHSEYYGYGCSGEVRSQGNSSHVLDKLSWNILEESSEKLRSLVIMYFNKC